METKLYLVRLGEISLKGLNRSYFEKTLKNNIKTKLRPYHSVVTKQKGRLYFEIDAACSDEVCDLAFSTTFGVVGYTKCIRCKKDMDVITQEARRLIDDGRFSNGNTFRCTAKRSDKNFPLDSHQLCCQMAELISARYPDLKVKLKNPDFDFFIEIRDKAYMFTTMKKGPSGLPVTTAGKGMLLLSGGIDSPVAGYRMAARGLKMECIYFHAYPYTSDEALQKVRMLAAKIAPYLQGTRLHVVPFTEQQLWIKTHCHEEETTLMFRACMMQVAQKIAVRHNATCIVTGEALSQVASQTLDSMAFTDKTTDLLVLRPLVGMGKEEIMDVARNIGTYETSILPYEDCCVIFSPKHPLTHPIAEVEMEHFTEMDISALLDKAVEETKTFDFLATGEEAEYNSAIKLH
ncbi:MAG: tRNA 4-thiouridine(8) synthase ThiI [Spirochaetia bacterium]|jgi:thiamine biosynthesis protein ThiI|nr:tRNA 4-thiouridine(8) synthase ThiI [Spirochaetia bacterium]